MVNKYKNRLHVKFFSNIFQNAKAKLLEYIGEFRLTLIFYLTRDSAGIRIIMQKSGHVSSKSDHFIFHEYFNKD